MLGLEIYGDEMRNSPLREKGVMGNSVGGKGMLQSSKKSVVTNLANLVRPFNKKTSSEALAELEMLRPKRGTKNRMPGQGQQGL